MGERLQQRWVGMRCAKMVRQSDHRLCGCSMFRVLAQRRERTHKERKQGLLRPSAKKSNEAFRLTRRSPLHCEPFEWNVRTRFAYGYQRSWTSVILLAAHSGIKWK